MKIKLLISPTNIKEVEDTILGTPDLVDIKNPSEGSLGANFTWVIQKSREKLDDFLKNNKNKEIKMSATIGDFPNLPGTASLAALGAAYSGADYIKIGLMGVKSKNESIKLSKSVVKAVKEFDNNKKVVIAGYADQKYINTSIDPLLIPEIAFKAGANVAMVDTAIKNGTSLFELLSIEDIERFLMKSKEYNIESALAGSLKFEDLDKLKTLEPNIIGVRSMVCENSDRLNGTIQYSKILKIKEILAS